MRVVVVFLLFVVANCGSPLEVANVVSAIPECGDRIALDLLAQATEGAYSDEGAPMTLREVNEVTEFSRNEATQTRNCNAYVTTNAGRHYRGYTLTLIPNSDQVSIEIHTRAFYDLSSGDLMQTIASRGNVSPADALQETLELVEHNNPEDFSPEATEYLRTNHPEEFEAALERGRVRRDNARQTQVEAATNK